MIKHYAIIHKADEKSPRLVRVLSERGADLVGLDQKFPHLDREKVSFSSKEIIQDLGPSPLPGKISGISTSDLYRNLAVELASGSTLFVFKKLPCEVDVFKEQALKSSKRLAVRFKRSGLSTLNSKEFIFEFRTLSKNVPFKYVKSTSKHPERIQVDVESLDGLEENLMRGVLLHVWEKLTTEFNKLGAAWARSYLRSIANEVVSHEECERLLEVLSEGISAGNITSLRELIGQLEAEDTVKVKYIASAIKRSHSLGSKDINLIIRGEDLDLIRNIWPTLSIVYFDKKPEVSEASLRSTEMFFVESMANFIIGNKLPEKIEKLCSSTLRYIQ